MILFMQFWLRKSQGAENAIHVLSSAMERMEQSGCVSIQHGLEICRTQSPSPYPWKKEEDFTLLQKGKIVVLPLS